MQGPKWELENGTDNDARDVSWQKSPEALADQFGIRRGIDVPVDLKTNEWTSLRDQFRALVLNEGGREDNLQQFVDDGIRRRFGELIAWAAGTNLRVIMAPGHRPISRQSVTAA
jgi:hypothetical protein